MVREDTHADTTIGPSGTLVQRPASTALPTIGHPKGTLAVLLLYMVLFVLGWAALFFFTFLPRGTPDARVEPVPAAEATPVQPAGGPGGGT